MKASFLLALIPFTALSGASAIPDTSKRQAQTVSVSWDNNYDVASSSTNIVACGASLSSKYPTLGAFPSFPNLGGALTIPDGTSSNCGKCYQLSYSSGTIQGSVTITAIDTSTSGFNIGLTAMNTLTDGNAERLGRVEATYVEVDCGY